MKLFIELCLTIYCLYLQGKFQFSHSINKNKIIYSVCAVTYTVDTCGIHHYIHTK